MTDGRSNNDNNNNKNNLIQRLEVTDKTSANKKKNGFGSIEVKGSVVITMTDYIMQ